MKSNRFQKYQVLCIVISSLFFSSRAQADMTDSLCLVGITNVMFLLDCSNSMSQLYGDPAQLKKSDEAKILVNKILKNIPERTSCGLRVFGQKFDLPPASQETNCKETALLVPLSQNRKNLLKQIRSIQSAGLSPIEFALRCTVEDDLKETQGDSLVILITDGGDTCNGHPAAYAKTIPNSVKILVVSLDGQNSSAIREHEVIAENARGKYYESHALEFLLNRTK
jgi:Ca-activated chloride channel family protein